MNDQPSPSAKTPWPIRFGAVIQGIALGGLLTFAVLNLLRVASDAQIFRYQGF